MTDGLRIRTEWLAADGIASADLAATFCRLEIWVGDRCVTRVEDRSSGSVRDGIFCSAYPLAEWIATHWWSLRWHVRAAIHHGDPTAAWAWGEPRRIDQRHDARAAGDGFLWPELTIVPEGEQTLLAWSERRDASDPIRYVTSGVRYLETDDVSRTLASFIESVIARLDACRVTETVLADEWSAIQKSDAAETAYCRAAAALGLDPYDVEPRVSALLEELGRTLGDALTTELAEAADVRLLSEDVRWIREAEQVLGESRPRASGVLTEFRTAMSATRVGGLVPPYRAGWDQARLARKVLGAERTSAIEIEKLVGIHGRPSLDPAVQGLAMSRADALNVVVGSRGGGKPSSRFLAGRALWRALIAAPDHAFLLTNATTWSHRVERAFSAELLAPAEGIRDQIGDARVVDAQTVDELARHFGVAGTLIRHQLDNQLQTTVVD